MITGVDFSGLKFPPGCSTGLGVVPGIRDLAAPRSAFAIAEKLSLLARIAPDAQALDCLAERAARDPRRQPEAAYLAAHAGAVQRLPPDHLRAALPAAPARALEKNLEGVGA